MPRICYFSGASTSSGNSRSHSMIASKRSFKPNLINKKVKMQDGSTMKIKISAKMFKKMKGFI